MIIDADRMRHMECAKEIASTSHIRCVDFSSDGGALITANENEAIELYNAQTGCKEKTTVSSKKYGLGIVRFVNNATTHAVHTSTKLDNYIRMVSLQDSRYLRYFKGHSKKVIGLCMAPSGHTFLSCSLDNSVRQWDTRSDHCQGQLACQGSVAAAFDPDGVIFAVGAGPGTIKLYDVRTFDRGSFCHFKIPQSSSIKWTKLEFSPCGKMILVNTNGDRIYLIDSFTGTLLRSFTGIENCENDNLDATLTPDSQFIWCGSSDGHLHCWETKTGLKVVSKKTNNGGMVVARWNPKSFSMVTASKSMDFWVCPDEES